MIDIYLSVILKSFRATAPDLNYNARASFVLTLVIGSILLTFLNISNICINELNVLIVVIVPLSIFVLLYRYLSNEEVEQRLIDTFEELNFNKKVAYSIASILFTISSWVIAFKTYSAMVNG